MCDWAPGRHPAISDNAAAVVYSLLNFHPSRGTDPQARSTCLQGIKCEIVNPVQGDAYLSITVAIASSDTTGLSERLAEDAGVFGNVSPSSKCGVTTADGKTATFIVLTSDAAPVAADVQSAFPDVTVPATLWKVTGVPDSDPRRAPPLSRRTRAPAAPSSLPHTTLCGGLAGQQTATHPTRTTRITPRSPPLLPQKLPPHQHFRSVLRHP